MASLEAIEFVLMSSWVWPESITRIVPIPTAHECSTVRYVMGFEDGITFTIEI